MKHIYWFAHYHLASPSVRYRGKYVLEALQLNHNISSTFVYPGYRFKHIWSFIHSYLSALFFRKKGAVIVIQRLHTKGIYGTALKILVKMRPSRTLFDLDDADYLKYPTGSLQYFMANCEHCSVGSLTLYEYVRKLNRNPFLLTTPVMDHGQRKTQRNELLTIGWIGCFWGGHRESVYSLLFPALKKLDRKIKLVILGVTNPAYKTEIIEYFSSTPEIETDIPLSINWKNEKLIYQMITSFDIGVSPLLDTEINRCKSAFKLKQYLSCGVPALASPVGENLRFLHEGENGFFCKDSHAFFEGILKFIDMSPQEYGRMSKKAWLASADFSYAHYCANLLAHFSESVTRE